MDSNNQPSLPIPPYPAADSSDLVDVLHSRGQRATPQRNVILRELRRRGRHATADEIRCAIRHELPGTSAPTVYATLELLVELGMARRIDTGLGASLYDARIEPHQHLACRRCGGVEDLDEALDTAALMRSAHAAGFHADQAELVISGLCAGCAEPDGPSRDPRRRASVRAGAPG